MSTPRRVVASRIIAHAVALAALCILPHGVTAQGGGAAGGDPPLTGARLDQLVSALRRGQQERAPIEGLRRQQEQLRARADSVEHPNAACRQRAFERLQQQHAGQMTSDPAAMQRTMEQIQTLSQQLIAATTSGNQKKADSLSKQIQKLQTSMMGGGAADSSAVDRQCGREASPAGAEARANELRRQADAIDEQVRQIEQRAEKAEVAASGLTPTQYASAKERVRNFLFTSKSNPAAKAFTSSEMSALQSHESQLRALLKG